MCPSVGLSSKEPDLRGIPSTPRSEHTRRRSETCIDGVWPSLSLQSYPAGQPPANVACVIPLSNENKRNCRTQLKKIAFPGQTRRHVLVKLSDSSTFKFLPIYLFFKHSIFPKLGVSQNCIVDV